MQACTNYTFMCTHHVSTHARTIPVHSLLFGLRRRFAKDDLGPVAPNRPALGLAGALRHHHDARRTRQGDRGPGHGLAVVPAAVGHHAGQDLFVGEQREGGKCSRICVAIYLGVPDEWRKSIRVYLAHPFVLLLGPEYRVGGPPHLERSRLLQVLALEEELAAGGVVEGGARQHRGLAEVGRDAASGRLDVANAHRVVGDVQELKSEQCQV